MKKYSTESMPQFFVGAAGGIAISLALSFGWYSKTKDTTEVLSVHSLILVAAGIGLLAAGVFVRHAAIRSVELEKQVTRLQQERRG